MVLVQGLGQESNSKFNRGLRKRFLLYRPPFEVVQSVKATDMSVFLPRGLVILLGGSLSYFLP